MPTIQRQGRKGKSLSTQTKLSPSFQTTISAEAVRALRLRPGMKFQQTVEGNRLILEPLEGVDSLAGSLGNGQGPVSVTEQNRGAKAAMAKAAMKGLAPRE